MTRQRSKIELIRTIQAEHKQLERNLATLTPEDLLKAGVVGESSVKDILAHLTAWEQLWLNWYEAGLSGKTPSPAPVGLSRSPIHALNQDIFERNRQRLLPSIRDEFQASYQHTLATVHAIREEDIFTPGRYAWTGRLTLADYVAGNTCNHYRWAKTHIRKWIKAQEAHSPASGQHAAEANE